jgi:hypothetical protein
MFRSLGFGDFFVSVPSGGAVYLHSPVIHDWDDDKTVGILKICAIGDLGANARLARSEALLRCHDAKVRDFGSSTARIEGLTPWDRAEGQT